MLLLKKYFLWTVSLVSLLIGIGFYLIFREPILASTWLGVEEFHLAQQLSWFNWLPSFVHQFSFVLLSWLVLEKNYKWFVLVFWLGVNGLFELGQALPNEYANYFPQVIRDYFKYGTYSHEDMLAIVVATVVAYTLMNKYEKGVFNG